MNPFQQQQQQGAAEEQRRRSAQAQQQLPRLNTGGGGSSQAAPSAGPARQPGFPRPPRQNSAGGPMSPPAQYATPNYEGGSFQHYAPGPPQQQQQQQPYASPPQYGDRPPMQQQVSFQEPGRRPQADRSGPSRESLKKPDMSDRRSSAGVSDMPELGRSQSQGLGFNNANLDPEQGFSGANANFRRKKSLVRPDRERMDPNHRQWYYRNHAAQMDAVDGQGRAPGFNYMPSTTGHLPQHGAAIPGTHMAGMQGPGGGISSLGMMPPQAGPSGYAQQQQQQQMGGLPHNMPPGGLGRPAPSTGIRRGKSILGREEDQVETGINILKRGVSLRRSRSTSRKDAPPPMPDSKNSKIAPGPVGPWMIYCYVLTICCPGPFLTVFGIKTPEQQRAWREKIGVCSIILLAMIFVGFITFGFTIAVCNNNTDRFSYDNIDTGSSVLHGYDYNFNDFIHPQVTPFQADGIYNRTNPAYSEPWLTGSRDISMLFQRVGDKCTDHLKLATGAQPTSYFACSIYSQNGTAVSSDPTWCHDNRISNNFFAASKMKRGQVSYSWKSVSNETRNLAVWKGAVLDLSRLRTLNANIVKPALFTQIQSRNDQFSGRDVTAHVLRSQQDGIWDCIEQIARVGYVDSESIGCIAADVELYVSLVFIIGVVGIKFLMAVIFGWFISWRLGNYGNETYEERMKRAAEIEKWSDDIYRPAPAGYRPNAKKHKSFLPTTSRFSTANALNLGSAPPKPGARTAMSEKGGFATSSGAASMTGSRSPAHRAGRLGPIGSPVSASPPGSPSLQGVRSSTSLVQGGFQGSYSHGSRRSSFSDSSPAQTGVMGACPWPLHNVVPQPPPDYQPFNFPLAHSICLVTAYSESFEGLRTTLDSLATTDYPNSHKVLLVIADGIVKGSGSEISTPDIVLSMMKDFIVPPEEVEGNSYVAIADGFKRHNMAKVYAGFYEYDDETVERSKQQRVPMVLVAKCGTPLEADGGKPGNRGKRDSQVLLMAFMQKVMFDERMTTFDYEFFNSIWRVTGVSPDHYEIVLMVDADTKVFPDSLSRMVACMVEDPEIMGLCGETKIANKTETWVTMIQVFEYYISHHQTKAFEACFGGVTCLPGCFSAYRIKAPKGPNGYWVPILANPDIVEHYSENVVDTLHKKNLLLLGEDRYLTTLMLKTFPKRKMMFVPQAVCKTVVPDTFRILLSQRRRWINSTVHNLSELVLVNDLCGTFCFSMRFVIFMELAGTLVLPAAIVFTFYVVAQAFYKDPVPVIPLILLAVILGLPGLLIVVTSRKLIYVGWMFIYLLSLPIWNFVFPAYAFWHMDDFTWGATRVVQGDKGGHHGDAEGKFDPSTIVMKRWGEFERERRWKSGTHSRDSTYDVVQRTGSPERQGSTRYSVVSSDTYHSHPSALADAQGRLLGGPQPHHAGYDSETGHSKTGSASGGARARLDAVPLLELPAPLGPDANKGRGAIGVAPGSVVVPRPREPSPATSTAPSQASYASRPPYEPYPTASSYNDDEARPMMASGASSPDPEGNMRASMIPSMTSVGLTADVQQVRHGSVSSEQRYPGVSEAQFAQGFSAEPEEDHAMPPQSRPPPTGQTRPTRESARPLSRGFSLVDDGPVAASGGAPRQVTRGARRQSNAPGAGGASPSTTAPPGGARERFSRQP